MSRHVSDDENVDDSENNGQEENENNSIEVDDENEGSDAQQGGNNSDGDSDENEQDSGDEDANNKPGGKIQPKTSKRGRSSVGSRRAGRPKGRHKARDNRYRVYIFKILQQVHPKIGITKTGMDILNSFVEDMFEQICNEAMKLCSFNKTSTITAREISTAAKLSVNNNTIFGELRKHAIMEGEKAVRTYQTQAKQLKEDRIAARGDKKGVFPGKRKKNKKHNNEQEEEQDE